MNVRNCKKCGKMFNYVSGVPICPQCKEAMEEKFQEVKKYVQDNPGVGIPQVSEACEVEVQQIREWIREERLEFADGSAIGLACEKCGASIRTGRFCDKCKASMINGMNDVLNAGRPKPPVEKKQTRDGSSKMRFL